MIGIRGDFYTPSLFLAQRIIKKISGSLDEGLWSKNCCCFRCWLTVGDSWLHRVSVSLESHIFSRSAFPLPLFLIYLASIATVLQQTDPKCLSHLLRCCKALTQQPRLSCFHCNLSLLTILLCTWPAETLYFLDWSYRKIFPYFVTIFMLYKTAVLNVYDFHGGLTFISTARTHSMPPLLCGRLMTRLLLTPVCGPIAQCSNELDL